MGGRSGAHGVVSIAPDAGLDIGRGGRRGSCREEHAARGLGCTRRALPLRDGRAVWGGGAPTRDGGRGQGAGMVIRSGGRSRCARRGEVPRRGHKARVGVGCVRGRGIAQAVVDRGRTRSRGSGCGSISRRVRWERASSGCHDVAVRGWQGHHLIGSGVSASEARPRAQSVPCPAGAGAAGRGAQPVGAGLAAGRGAP